MHPGKREDDLHVLDGVLIGCEEHMLQLRIDTVNAHVQDSLLLAWPRDFNVDVFISSRLLRQPVRGHLRDKCDALPRC